MWEAIIALLAGAAVAAAEVPGLIKRRSWRMLFAFVTMLVTGLVILVCFFIGIEMPIPLEPLRVVFEPVGKALRRE